MPSTVRVDGLKELDQALGELGKAAGRNTLKRGLAKAAQPIAAKARALVPVDTAHLKDSITVSSKIVNNVGRSEYGEVLRSGGSRGEASAAMRGARRGGNYETRAEVHVGPGNIPYAHLVEFGTVKMAAKPFLRPAFESEKEGAVASLADTLRDEISKTAARQARKAARLAAKG